jgi:chromosome partitioning protein
MDTAQQKNSESDFIIGEVDEIGIDRIEVIEHMAYQVIENLRKKVFSPSQEKVLNVKYTISQAAEMVGRTTTTIRESEVEGGRLPIPKKDERGRRVGYTLEEINKMRQVFGTQPYRDESKDEPVIIAIQSFKGGVGKSTLTAHLAQSFAEDGYRVCVIDTDPQASTTSLFGLNPDLDLEYENTLYPFLAGEQANIHYAVRDTYWDQLKLVPSTLDLYDIEYELAGRLPGNPRLLDKLRIGIAELAKDFDIVLIDPPPALGMISLSVLRAANALVVPVRPATIDFGSTAHFFTMLKDSLKKLAEFGMRPSYKFLKVIANDMDDNKSAHVEITNMMRNVFGPEMFNTVMKDSAEIDNAGARLMTVYELDKPITSKKTHDRCRVYLDALNKELRTLIRRTWPSQRESLRQEGAV